MKALAEKVLGACTSIWSRCRTSRPTPMTLSSVMFYTGENPYTHEAVYVARSQEEKRRQKSYFFSRTAEASGSVRQGGFGKRVEEGARSKELPLHPGSGKRLTGLEEARNRSEKHDTSPAGARQESVSRNRKRPGTGRGKGAVRGKGAAQEKGSALKRPALKKR